MKNKQINFTLFKEPWTITYRDVVSQESANGGEFTDGICNAEEFKIELATKTSNGNNKPARYLEMVKLHELVHCILSTGCYIEENRNEPLVEWIAKCLLDLKEQKII